MKRDYLHITDFTADEIHATTLENREAVYRFFQQTLERPGDPEEEAVTLIDPEELRITETGQVATSLGGRTVFDLVAAELAPGLAALEEGRARGRSAEIADRIESARDLAGYQPPAPTPASSTADALSVSRRLTNRVWDAS